jgi:hypothetical protein
MLTIGKNIQAEGYQGWITKRIRGFMGTLGLDEGDTIWVGETYPTLATLNSLNTLSSAFFLRMEIFRTCWASAIPQDRYSNLFKYVISMLKGSSMTHIIMIEVYLYTRYTDLLSIRMLAENHKSMLAA